MPDDSSAPVALMTAAEAARILRTTPATIRRRMQAGQLQALPLAKGSARFALADVLALANREWNAPPLTAERHVCLFVREPERFSQALLALIVTPLAAGNVVVLALDRVQARLGALLTDPLAQRVHAEDRLRAVEAAAVYLNAGRFDDTAVFERLARLSSDIGLAASPWVFVGEMSWAAEQLSSAETARYEVGLNKLLSEQPVISLVCVYDASRFDGETVLAVLQTHPVAWIDGIRQVGFIPESKR